MRRKAAYEDNGEPNQCVPPHVSDRISKFRPTARSPVPLQAPFALATRLLHTRRGRGSGVCIARLCELEHTGYGIQLPGFDMIIVIRMAAGACGISSIHKGGTPCSVASLCIESEVGLPKRMRGAFQAYAQERTGQPGRVSCDDPVPRPIGYIPSVAYAPRTPSVLVPFLPFEESVQVCVGLSVSRP